MRRVPWIVSGASSVMAVITWQVVFITAMHEGLGAGFIGNHFFLRPRSHLGLFRPLNQAGQRFADASPIWTCTAPK
jgi:hypothetical protein